MLFSNRIRLFWWNEKVIQGKSKENYGDVLGKYLVEKISGKNAVFAWPKKFSILDWFAPIYATVGSILANVNGKCIVWGSGIIDQKTKIKNAVFLAVRGPHFNPKIEKKYKFGFVPHYNDYKLVQDWFSENPDVLLIDMMTNDIESKTIEFLQCEKIISSSLHGIIIAHAYGIPAVWQKFSDKVFGDDIKYQDYFESVQLLFYNPEIRISPFTAGEMENLFAALPSLPLKENVEKLCDGLMEVCPFK